MFGRKGMNSPPPRPRVDLAAIVAPGGKIDLAMRAAIALFSDTLAAAGKDAGALSLDGPFPSEIARMIGDCIVYDGDKGPEFVTLGVTKDFKAFSYQPHCYLFMIANAVGIAETLPERAERARFAAPQCPEALFHAHVTRLWIRHILPVGRAMSAGDTSALTMCLNAVQEDIGAILRGTPEWMRHEVDVVKLANEWIEGFPATIGRPLDASVPRMNGIPMTEFVENLLTDWLARLQADGLRQERRAG
jgi:hypothetical protein